MTTTTRSPVEDVDSRTKRIWVDYTLLAVPCVTSPFLVWAQNPQRVGHPERLLVIGMGAWVVASALLWLARRLGAGRSQSLIGAWVAALVFMRGGAFPQTYGYPMALLLAGTAVGIGSYLVARQTGDRARPLIVAASVLLVAELAFIATTQWASAGEDLTVDAPEIETVLDEKPDIFFVVADAYIGIDGLQRYFGVDEPEIRDELEVRGFLVPELAFSAYPTTSGGLSAMLDMSYPLRSGPAISASTARSLYSMIGGDNNLVGLLRDNGYTTTFVESAWSGSMCGPAIDVCVASTFYDESTFLALHKTWLGTALVDRVGYSFTRGSLTSADWLQRNANRIVSNDDPDFVLIHLEIPHPPLHLEADCSLNTSRERRGVTLQIPGVDPAVRQRAYLDQAKCVDSIVLDAVDEIGPDEVVIFAGDHGSDLHNQLAKHPREWTADERRERLNAMLAVRTPLPCALEEPVLMVNLFSDVLGCLGADGLERSIPRFFLSSSLRFGDDPEQVVELSSDQVAELLTESTPTSP